MNEKMDELWEATVDPNPEILARQLAALKVWLLRPVLTLRQAACLIAGVCPPERRLDDRAFGAHLPGRQEWEIAPEIGRTIMVERIEEVETLMRETMPFEGTTPVDFVRLGFRIDVLPPWMDFALKNDECRRLLPPELANITPKKPLKNASQQKKAKQRWANEDKLILLDNEGRNEFLKLRELNFFGHTWKNGRVKIASIARAVLEAITKAAPDEPDCLVGQRTAERHVKIWLSNDRTDIAPALSDNTGA